MTEIPNEAVEEAAKALAADDGNAATFDLENIGMEAGKRFAKVYREKAQAAIEAALPYLLAASPHPVSGGPEGDVEALVSEVRADIRTALLHLDRERAELVRVCLNEALTRLATLSRVPADGERITCHDCGGSGILSDLEGGVDCPYCEARGRYPGSRQERPPEAGLGDRQLTAEERHACKIGAEAIRAMGVGVEDEPVDGDHAELIESLQALGRLASGENPDG